MKQDFGFTNPRGCTEDKCIFDTWQMLCVPSIPLVRSEIYEQRKCWLARSGDEQAGLDMELLVSTGSRIIGLLLNASCIP